MQGGSDDDLRRLQTDSLDSAKNHPELGQTSGKNAPAFSPGPPELFGSGAALAAGQLAPEANYLGSEAN